MGPTLSRLSLCCNEKCRAGKWVNIAGVTTGCICYQSAYIVYLSFNLYWKNFIIKEVNLCWTIPQNGEDSNPQM